MAIRQGAFAVGLEWRQQTGSRRSRPRNGRRVTTLSLYLIERIEALEADVC